MEKMRESTQELASKVWFVNATDEVVKLGNAILGNIIMLGALSGPGVLPLKKEDLGEAILRTVPQNKLTINLKAYDIGIKSIGKFSTHSSPINSLLIL